MSRRTRPPLGWNTARPRADLVGEAEQVELDAELAVVALGRLLEAVEVRLERLLRVPRRAVDALELRVALLAAPVGAGDPHQLEVAEVEAGVGHVRAAAQVDEARVAGERRRVLRVRRRVLVGAHRLGRRRGRHRVRAGVVDDLELEPVAGEHLAGLLGRELVADERLRLRDDLAHARVDPLEVVLDERAAVGQLEVVVEAVLHRRADAERGAREQVEHGLGEHVGRGVADREQARGRCRR